MLFFFYGTLMAGHENAVARAVHARLRALGPATARGLLYAIADADGWYPAIIDGDGIVHGQLYEPLAAFGSADLAALDAYENFDPERLEDSDYLRREIRVSDGLGLDRMAQAYLWRLPVPTTSRFIEGGNFDAWLRQTGLPAFR